MFIVIKLSGNVNSCDEAYMHPSFDNHMRSVIITGVAGLIGSRLADWLLSNQPDIKIIGIDDFSGGYIENVDPRVELYRLDLSDRHRKDVLRAIFERHRPTYVFHFAAYAAEALSPFIRSYNYANNVLSTVHVVNECIRFGIKRLVYTSSMSVYGNGIVPFDEVAQRSPIDPYGVSKAACEADIEIAGEQHGLDYCIIRPHNFYGAKQNIWDSYRNVLGIWMYKRLTNQPLTIFGDGLQVRAFSYIDDSLHCFWNAAVEPRCSKQIINLGGLEEVTIKRAAETLLDVMGGGELVYLEPRHEVKHAVPTGLKSIELLGFEHRTELRDGLAKMWRWAKHQPMRPRQVWTEYELNQKLYPFWDQSVLVSQAPEVSMR